MKAILNETPRGVDVARAAANRGPTRGGRSPGGEAGRLPVGDGGLLPNGKRKQPGSLPDGTFPIVNGLPDYPDHNTANGPLPFWGNFDVPGDINYHGETDTPMPNGPQPTPNGQYGFNTWDVGQGGNGPNEWQTDQAPVGDIPPHIIAMLKQYAEGNSRGTPQQFDPYLAGGPR